MGGCLSSPEQSSVKYSTPPPGQQGIYPQVPIQTYAVAAGAGAPQPGQWPATQAVAAGPGYTVCETLFFPDPALPCHNARKPGGCRYMGMLLPLTCCCL